MKSTAIETFESLEVLCERTDTAYIAEVLRNHGIGRVEVLSDVKSPPGIISYTVNYQHSEGRIGPFRVESSYDPKDRHGFLPAEMNALSAAYALVLGHASKRPFFFGEFYGILFVEQPPFQARKARNQQFIHSTASPDEGLLVNSSIEQPPRAHELSFLSTIPPLPHHRGRIYAATGLSEAYCRCMKKEPTGGHLAFERPFSVPLIAHCSYQG